MSCNLLKLNSNKTELMVVGPKALEISGWLFTSLFFLPCETHSIPSETCWEWLHPLKVPPSRARHFQNPPLQPGPSMASDLCVPCQSCCEIQIIIIITVDIDWLTDVHSVNIIASKQSFPLCHNVHATRSLLLGAQHVSDPVCPAALIHF